jgi:hypothetical protein
LLIFIALTLTGEIPENVLDAIRAVRSSDRRETGSETAKSTKPPIPDIAMLDQHLDAGRRHRR